MATWLLGAPDRVQALAGRWVKNDIGVDDNGLLCLQYERAVGLCEGSWTEAGATRLEGPTIHGEKGSIADQRAGCRHVRWPRIFWICANISMRGATEFVWRGPR